MTETVTGQVSQSAAEVYDAFFVPALFEPWARIVADVADPGPGEQALDIACGTGVLAREMAKRVLPSGTVAGVDRNEGMIAVARERAAEIEWRVAQAESLPYSDATFDAVVSQFGLMFFEDRSKAITEMWRVLRPKGRLAVAVWDKLENILGYAVLAKLLERLYGARLAAEISAPFSMGDVAELTELFEGAGASGVKVRTVERHATFPSVEAWIRLDLEAWTLGDMLDDAQTEVLLREAEQAMKPFILDDGRCSFPAAAHIVTATKPG